MGSDRNKTVLLSGYRSDIDGLRALAVVPVVLYHADLGFSGGFVGVDVFFVISGYLITSLIIKDLDAGKFSLIDFWSRRVRRIIPAITAVMLASLIAGWFIFWPEDYKDLGLSAAAQSVFSSNIYFWLQSGYFEDPSATKPLLHTWSLSVEEQFYVLYPFFLLILYRVRKNRHLFVIAAVAVISLALSIFGVYKHPSATFYLLPMRAWELLAGGLIAMGAFSSIKLSRVLAEIVSLTGLFMILAAALFYDREMKFPGLAALAPVLGAVFIIWANSKYETLVGQMLSMPPMIFVGLISYSLYLWHWPVLVFSEYWALDALNFESRVLLVMASILLAIISWKWIELPFRKKRLMSHYGKVISAGAVSLAVVFSSGFLVAETEGGSTRISPQVAAYAAAKKDRLKMHELTVDDIKNGNLVPIGMMDESAPVNTLLWGDSHANAVLPVIDNLCKDRELKCVAITHSSTAPLVGFASNTKYGLKADSIPFADEVIRYIRANRVKNVILVALWRGYGLDEKVELHQVLSTTVDAIHGAGAKAWIMVEAPSHDVDVPRALARSALAGQELSTIGVRAKDQWLKVELQRSVFMSMGENTSVLDPFDSFCKKQEYCQVAGNGRSFYSDNHHLSVSGSKQLASMFGVVFQSGPF